MRSSGNIGVKGVTWVLIYLLTIFPVYGGLGLTPSALAASEESPASGDASGLVQQGVNYYEINDLNQARSAFESAEVIYPEDKVIPYYLGLINLEEGHRKEAIDQWKKYVKLAPEDETAKKIRRNITLLLRKEAKDSAKAAVAAEQKMSSSTIDDNTVAVTSFKNLGSGNLGPLGKGMAAMIIADLSQFNDLKVVEREKLQALLDEMKMGTTGIVDEKSAPKVGRLLQAKYVTSGTMVDLEKQNLQVASILFDAASNTPTGFQEIEGGLKEFHQVEKKIACSIVTDLGRNCDQAPEAFKKIHTKSLAALTAFSYGLDYIDKDKFEEARAKLQEAVKIDPNFDLAQATLAGLPTADMLTMSEAEMASAAAADAPLVAGEAAGGSGVVVAETSSESGGVSLGTTAAIAGGGLAAVGLVAAAVALSGGDEGGDDGKEDNGISGTWNGPWNTADGEEKGSLLLDLEQSDSSFSGRFSTIANGGESQVLACIQSGTVEGTLNGNTVTMTLTSNTGATITTQNANTFNNSEGTITGELRIESGDCSGTVLQYNLSSTGGVRVTW